MANDETWKKLKFFKKDSKVDRWGDAGLIEDCLLLMLDDFRRDLGCPIYVVKGVATSGHKDGSYHYAKRSEDGTLIGVPCAVDIVVPNYQHTPFDLVTEAARFGFKGIGYYPHWRWSGKTVGGLHLDNRPLKKDPDGTINYRHNRWLGVLNLEGKQDYIPLTFHNMWKYTQEGNDDGISGLH